ncbi:MAG: type II toxin-antitoxin system prevent-host-death family antitoxin [Deltaproteobacteria bacterium]|nr:type II toxin-antitoxin system prevent-host-death family antitoxin [Deltaproteobacteria bacterium]
MKSMDMGQATAPLSEYAGRLKREAVILTNKGRPVAALVSLEDADWETIRLSTDPRFNRIISRSRRKHRDCGGIPAAEMRRRVGA